MFIFSFLKNVLKEMGLFEKKEKSQDQPEEKLEKKEFIEKPKIFLFDMPEECKILEAEGYNVFSGTLGSIINIPNKKRNDSHLCLLNYDYPENLHEFDIIIVDQTPGNFIEYKVEDHKRTSTKGSEEIYLISEFPQTKFDPRPLSGFLMAKATEDLQRKGGIIITFGEAFEEIEYETIKISSDFPKRQMKSKYNNYSFLGYVPYSQNKTGTQIEIQNVFESLKTALEVHAKDSFYYATFYHPEVRDKDYKTIPNPNFIPLIKNNNGDIISFFTVVNKLGQFVFPQIKNKGEFLKELLSAFLPDLYPELFPYSTRFKWIEKKDYWLPKYESLLKEKRDIEDEFKKKIEEVESKIERNLNNYCYLHKLLTETGDKLVEAVEKFLYFLNFQNIRNVDKESPTIKEEDLQVTFPDGLLVIEVKGIGGIPKDIDCNQISKIKYRRAKDRNVFDVKALTIINHQRYLPPLSRTNPPFTEQQINDAENDERGLVTTWQLFNLFYEVTNGIINKEDARTSLLNTGLIKFKPSDIELIGTPKEIHYNGHVVIVNLKNQELHTGEKLFINQDGRYMETTIVTIQQDGQFVDKAESGAIGLKLDTKVIENSELWRVKKNT